MGCTAFRAKGRGSGNDVIVGLCRWSLKIGPVKKRGIEHGLLFRRQGLKSFGIEMAVEIAPGRAFGGSVTRYEVEAEKVPVSEAKQATTEHEATTATAIKDLME